MTFSIYEHGNTDIWSELQIANTSLDILTMRVIEMTIHDLLCQSERALKSQDTISDKDQESPLIVQLPVANNGKIVFNSLIVDIRALFEKRHRNFGVPNSWCSGGHPGSQPPQGVCGAMREVEHRPRRRARWQKKRRYKYPSEMTFRFLAAFPQIKHVNGLPIRIEQFVSTIGMQSYTAQLPHSYLFILFPYCYVDDLLH